MIRTKLGGERRSLQIPRTVAMLANTKPPASFRFPAVLKR